MDSGQLVPESVLQPRHYAILSLFPTHTQMGAKREKTGAGVGLNNTGFVSPLTTLERQTEESHSSP